MTNEKAPTYIVHGRMWGDDDDTVAAFSAPSVDAAECLWKRSFGLTPELEREHAATFGEPSAFGLFQVFGPYWVTK